MRFPCKVDKNRYGYKFLDKVKKNGIFYCFHPGIDFNYGKTAWGDYGGDVCAIADGLVVYSKYALGWGNLIVLYHPQYNIYSRNAHLSSLKVIKNQVIKEGHLVGHIGMTGNSSGPHLHFDLITKKLLYWTKYTRFMSKEKVMEYYVDPILWIEEIIKKEAKEKKISEIYLHDWKDKNGKNISKEAWDWATKKQEFISQKTHPQEILTYERYAIIEKRICDPMLKKLEDLEKKVNKLYDKNNR